jgi:hypothetical protein
MESHGDDLTRSRDIDFMVVFPDETSARKFAEQIISAGYVTSVTFAQVEEDHPWDVRVVKHMIPSYEGICEFENALERAAEPLGGQNDGWGCFEQPILN